MKLLWHALPSKLQELFCSRRLILQLKRLIAWTLEIVQVSTATRFYMQCKVPEMYSLSPYGTFAHSFLVPFGACTGLRAVTFRKAIKASCRSALVRDHSQSTPTVVAAEWAALGEAAAQVVCKGTRRRRTPRSLTSPTWKTNAQTSDLHVSSISCGDTMVPIIQ